jgi:ABC-type transport system substrate-binding protein
VRTCHGQITQRPGQGGPARYAANGTFTLATEKDLGPFDPYRGNILDFAPLAYDSLVNLQPNGTFASGLANKWHADARSATFTLRSGVTCSDGSPLTASQTAAAINFVSNPKNKSRLYGVITPTVSVSATADPHEHSHAQVTGEDDGSSARAARYRLSVLVLRERGLGVVGE